MSKKVKLPKIRELNINEAAWGQNTLCNADGTMCCLGFLSRACGVPKAQMHAHGMPNELMRGAEVIARVPGERLNAFFRQAATINDDNSLDTTERKTKLTALFKKQGIKLRFTRGHKPKPLPFSVD